MKVCFGTRQVLELDKYGCDVFILLFYPMATCDILEKGESVLSGKKVVQLWFYHHIMFS